MPQTLSETITTTVTAVYICHRYRCDKSIIILGFYFVENAKKNLPIFSDWYQPKWISLIHWSVCRYPVIHDRILFTETAVTMNQLWGHGCRDCELALSNRRSAVGILIVRICSNSANSLSPMTSPPQPVHCAGFACGIRSGFCRPKWSYSHQWSPLSAWALISGSPKK